ncbi:MULTISPECIES: hypothetical protein [Paenibacillus]|nr:MULTISPECIES: hypothetical protein [Paenibacillus]SLK16221.1 hypothetical protein SAMN06272722_110104 [Paenibacillus sp. RU5A]SOC74264.1 hypothetical protein SAMN05880581_110104 [Paenibacillus sp. RU26A]SOC76414.1 hypothetical protein SAMN05880586_110104 [Paenibacillus sp. RU5M]
MDNIGIALGGGKAFSIPTMFVLFIIAIAIFGMCKFVHQFREELV